MTTLFRSLLGSRWRCGLATFVGAATSQAATTTLEPSPDVVVTSSTAQTSTEQLDADASVADLASASGSAGKTTSRSKRRPTTVIESSQNFALELRVGPYAPNIDEGSERTAQQDYFGSGDRVYVGFEFDWQFLRIPYLGSLGIGGGLGYARLSGLNKLENGATNPTEKPITQKSTLVIVPFHAVGVLRVDEAARRFSVPLVPYAKLGMGYSTWTVNDGIGIARTADGELGQGSSTGLHAALGGMLLLDVIEPSAARSLDVESGINNSYLFLEWSYSSVGGQEEMSLGDSTWVAGLALEM